MNCSIYEYYSKLHTDLKWYTYRFSYEKPNDSKDIYYSVDIYQ